MNVSELDINKVRPRARGGDHRRGPARRDLHGTVDKVNINGTTTNGFTTYPVTILLREYGALQLPA